MRAYAIRRLLLVIPVVFLVSIIIFFLMRLIPGDLISAMLAAPGAQEQGLDRAALEQAMGLDEPLIKQYGRWLGVVPQMDGNFSGLFQGNLGHSYWRNMPVLDLLALKWPVTFELGLMAIIAN